MLYYSQQTELTITLSQAIIRSFTQERQRWLSQSEAGGQLFGYVSPKRWHIEACTGPRPADKRSPWGYIPDTLAENAEIMSMYKQGLHFLGDWHTHFQKTPLPSRQDIATTQRCYRRSNTELPGFILIVVGREFPRVPCSLSLVDGGKVIQFYVQEHTPQNNAGAKCSP